ncbi:MAG: hypothetical protein KF883_13005 [Thermomicrobiales bacterium]|nr:hypothetical protein [Thermomicrobiales bacterium]
MQPVVLDAKTPAIDAIGAIVAEEVRAGGKRLFRKGEIITEANAAGLARLDRQIHAVRPDPDEIHEDDAARELAVLIAGEGTEIRKPVLSRVNIRAARKGLLRVDVERVQELNLIPDVAIFTQLDRLAVLPGKVLAGVKISPVVTPRSTIERAAEIARDRQIVQVKPFLPLRVGVLSTEGMNDKARDRFQESVRRKIDWYGAELLGFDDLPKDAGAVAGSIQGYVDRGADLVLAGGGNTIDPLDATLQALPRVDAEIVTFGAPVHPGSMLWLAYRGDVPVFNLASCSMYSRSTSADLILPWIMAGERVGARDIAALGYGGSLDRDMQYRFPPYDAETVTDEPES